ncbi:hypothetical protein [Thioflexithrix psekupsensis]|nr:hypothetical protein [Thioflexithrix psekupsensis]
MSLFFKMRFSFLLMLLALLSACAKVPTHEGCYVAEPYVNGRYVGACDTFRRAHGQGVAQGTDTYKGEFNAGVIEGWGLYTWSNGATFCGQFKAGKMSGVGIYTDSSGKRQEGIWNGTQRVETYQTGRLTCTIR